MDTPTRDVPGPRRATFVEGTPLPPDADENVRGLERWARALVQRLRSLSFRTWVAMSAVLFLCGVLATSITAVALSGAGTTISPEDASPLTPENDADTSAGGTQDPALEAPESTELSESETPAQPDARYFRAGWSDDVHLVDASGAATLISAEQWQSAGSPPVEVAPTRYVMTPWSSTVYGLVTWPAADGDDADGAGSFVVVPLSAEQFDDAGSPATEQIRRVPGDSFVQFTEGSSIFHVVGAELTPLTVQEWEALGSPAPRVQAPESPTYIRGILLVNKSFPLPSSFGDGLTDETVDAFEAMRVAAASSNLSLRVVSGFRSFASQDALYSRYVRSQGQAEADRFSARPGHSEHQTGLTVDINQTTAGFADTAEGRWVAENAHLFGFIVRYPEGKEEITGYTFEPWHVRYVGVEVATHLKETGLTLDEYLGVSSVYEGSSGEQNE